MKISIVIPSRERGSYLEHSLATATAIEDPDLEIVVSDNASIDNTREVVETCGDPRVRYVNTGARLSMRLNFELGMRTCTGDYVIFFGDDDGIVPGQFPVLREILETRKPDALSWDFLTYSWPIKGFGSKVGGVRLRRELCFGAPYEYDAATRLRALERGVSDMSDPLPVLYHGCFSRAFLEQLKGDEGDYFKAMSPDLYISYRALQHGGKFVHAHHPFSINGISPASTGNSMSSLGSDGEKKADLSFLSEIKTDPLQDVIPTTKSMALAFLGTLQTVQARFPDAPPITPDYEAWYKLALADQQKKDAATAAEITASLDAHAEQFASHDALARARQSGPPSVWARLTRAVRRTTAKRSSFRVSTEQDGHNTILTAARTCDALLGGDMDAIMQGKLSQPAAWANMKNRSADFEKQL